MKIGFFTAFYHDPLHYVLAQRLIESAKTTMPTVPIIQLTDDLSPQVYGVDEVVRTKRTNILDNRIELYSQCKGDWLLVDTDIEILGSLEHVFEKDFDIALADRNWEHLPQPAEVLDTMPFNSGVIFSKNQSVLKELRKIWISNNKTDWMSEQRAIAQLVKENKFKVTILPGMIYNYPPSSPTDNNPDCLIMHYKGERKQWYWDKIMLQPYGIK